MTRERLHEMAQQWLTSVGLYGVDPPINSLVDLLEHVAIETRVRADEYWQKECQRIRDEARR